MHVAIELQVLAPLPIETDDHAALVRCGIGTCLNLAHQRTGGARQREARRDHVDGASGCCGAEQQRGGTADDFDTLGHQRFYADCVIIGERSRIEGVGTVHERLYAQPALTANDGTARNGSERRCGNARLLGERLAEAALEHGDEVVATNHGDRLRRRERLAAQRGGGDHDFVQVVDLGCRLGCRMAAECIRQAEQQHGRGATHAGESGFGHGEGLH